VVDDKVYDRTGRTRREGHPELVEGSIPATERLPSTRRLQSGKKNTENKWRCWLGVRQQDFENNNEPRHKDTDSCQRDLKVRCSTRLSEFVNGHGFTPKVSHCEPRSGS
jgi:hypothetical protein